MLQASRARQQEKHNPCCLCRWRGLEASGRQPEADLSLSPAPEPGGPWSLVRPGSSCSEAAPPLSSNTSAATTGSQPPSSISTTTTIAITKTLSQASQGSTQTAGRTDLLHSRLSPITLKERPPRPQPPTPACMQISSGVQTHVGYPAVLRHLCNDQRQPALRRQPAIAIRSISV